MNYCHYLYSSLLFSFFLLISVFYFTPSDVWEVFLLGIPAHIDTSLYNSNMGIYLLRQTHAPLFEHRDDGSYQSSILSSWERDRHYKTFSFCLNGQHEHETNAEFFPGKRLSATLVRELLQKVMQDHHYLGDVVLNPLTSCVKVTLQHSCPELLSHLASYRYAPTLSHSGDGHALGFEWGLGDFYPIYQNHEMVILKRKKIDFFSFRKINIIRFYNYQKLREGHFAHLGKRVDDYNHLLVEQIPLSVKKNYHKSYVPLLQTVNLVLNHPAIEVRDFFYNCVDMDELLHAFFPEQKSFYHIKSPLPVGLKGGEKGVISQQCHPATLASTFKGKEFIFVNWNDAVQSNVEAFWQKFNAKFGVHVKVKKMALNEFILKALQVPHDFDLSIMAIDGVEEGSYDFFKCLVDQQKIIDQDYPLLKDYISKLIYDDSSLEQVAHFITEKRIVLPLFQEIRPFYWPHYYGNFKDQDNFLGQPQLGKLELF